LFPKNPGLYMATGASTLAGGRELLAPATKKAKWDLDLARFPNRGRLHVAPAKPREIAPLVASAQEATGVVLASVEIVATVAGKNPEALWVFHRGDRIVGGVALLMLNREGLAHLRADALDLRDPPRDCLASPGQAPAAIYVWALLGRSVAAEGIGRIIERLQSAPFRDADLYAFPATRSGRSLMLALGFEPVPAHPRALYRYRRRARDGSPAGGSLHAS
jgi:hypothetical protein